MSLKVTLDSSSTRRTVARPGSGFAEDGFVQGVRFVLNKASPQDKGTGGNQRKQCGRKIAGEHALRNYER
eukprot:1183260-Prorocentrum_minimum.AAC.5